MCITFIPTTYKYAMVEIVSLRSFNFKKSVLDFFAPRSKVKVVHRMRVNAVNAC